jgi:hypothetical protein
MTKRYWHIEGYDGTKKIFEKRVKVGLFSQNMVKALLMALTAKAGLNFEEIVGAYAKKKTKISNDLLTIQKDGPYLTFMYGENPHFIAKVIEEID